MYIKDGKNRLKYSPPWPALAYPGLPWPTLARPGPPPLIHQKPPSVGCGCVEYCVVFWVCYSASIESKRKGAKVKGLQILAIVALVTGFVWAGIGIIGQSAGLVQLAAIVACVGMLSAILSILFMEC